MKYFLSNRITPYMIFFSLVLLGIISMFRLTLSLMPDVTYPAISVIIDYPGVSAEKIEQILTRPSENIIKTIDGIKSINSVSEEGKCRININFNIKTNIKMAALKVREKIFLIRDSFPKDVQEPVIVRYDPNNKPIIISTVKKISGNDEFFREEIEKGLKNKIQRIEGVSEIYIAGGNQKEIHIDIDKYKYNAIDLNLNQISGMVQDNNLLLPTTSITNSSMTRVINSSINYKSLSDISNLPVSVTDNGSVIRLNDFADIDFKNKDLETHARLNGSNEIIVYIHQANDANCLKLSKEIKKLFSSEKRYDFNIIYDQSRYIILAIRNVVFSFIWGIFVVFIVLSLMIDRRSTLLAIILSIPICVLSNFFFMFVLGQELNIISLAGLSIATGLIVDNCIIISENIFAAGKITLSKVYLTVKNFSNPLLASTATTIAVFLPILLFNEELKRMYSGFAFTISVTLFLSYILSMIFIPAFILSLSDKIDMKKKKEVSVLSKTVLSAKTKIFSIQNSLQNSYSKLLHKTVFNQKKALILFLSAVFITAVIYTLIPQKNINPLSVKEYYIYLEFPTGTSLEETNSASVIVENYILSKNITKKLSTKVEKSHSTIIIEPKNSVNIDEISENLRNDINRTLVKFEGYSFISEADVSPTNELNINIIGNDNTELRKLAKLCASEIEKCRTVEECVLRFKENRPEYILTLDAGKASKLGISSKYISNFMRNILFGPVSTKFIDNENEIDVRIKYKKQFTSPINTLVNGGIKNGSNEIIPIEEIVSVKESEGLNKIWRLNKRRNVTITAKIGSSSYNKSILEINNSLKNIHFPNEYYYEYDEKVIETIRNNRNIIYAVISSVIVIYMILAALFESLFEPVLIIVTIPLAVMGVFWALFITRNSLNLSVYIGLIVLSGIVVNNGIILIDSINKKIRKYLSENNSSSEKFLFTEIRGICLLRFRSILITTLTTVFGMIPMLFSSGNGSALWKPIAITVISGLSVSTVLSLFILPTIIYNLYIHKMRSL